MTDNIAACTIVSLNYLPYAKILSNSYYKHHPGGRFFVLVVDRKINAVDLSEEEYEVVFIEDLHLPEFTSIAFKYNILELNTGIKPSFLKHLFCKGVKKLIYLDPDIQIYKPLDEIFSILDQREVVLTPHITCPLPLEKRTREQIFLLSGVYNLGFIGLRSGDTTSRLLDWWEKHCLHLGYLELESGLFVDQKWIGLAPCFFESVHILKHPGCNMAHWNLHERNLTWTEGKWMVNDLFPLVFFHFSGIDPSDTDQISKYQDEYNLTNREDLRELFSSYRLELKEAGIFDSRTMHYSFGSYSNGEPIAPLARKIYSIVQESFSGSDPFDAGGSFYAWARKNRLLMRGGEQSSDIALPKRQRESKERFLNQFLRLALRLLGPEHYLRLMKYLSHISSPRNQLDLFKK